MSNSSAQEHTQLVIDGAFVSVIGLISCFIASYLTETGQREILTIRDSLNLIGLGTIFWVVGCIQFLDKIFKR